MFNCSCSIVHKKSLFKFLILANRLRDASAAQSCSSIVATAYGGYQVGHGHGFTVLDSWIGHNHAYKKRLELGLVCRSELRFWLEPR